MDDYWHTINSACGCEICDDALNDAVAWFYALQEASKATTARTDLLVNRPALDTLRPSKAQTKAHTSKGGLG